MTLKLYPPVDDAIGQPAPREARARRSRARSHWCPGRDVVLLAMASGGCVISSGTILVFLLKAARLEAGVDEHVMIMSAVTIIMALTAAALGRLAVNRAKRERRRHQRNMKRIRP